MSELLFHYTRAKTLMSILSARELWFSDFRALHDDEPRILRRIVANTLDWIERHGRARTALATLTPAQIASFETAWRQFRDRFVQLNLFRGQTPIPFVFNLSAADDCPSLWRNPGSEICIEFSRAGLQRATGLSPVKVTYLAETDIDPTLAAALDDHLLALFQDPPQIFPVAPMLHRAHRAFQIVAIKSAAFREQREHRLIRGFRYGHDEGLFFDMGVYAQPRAAIRLSNRVRFADVIAGLRFGPGFDRTLAMHMVRSLNRAHGLDVFPEFSRQLVPADQAA